MNTQTVSKERVEEKIKRLNKFLVGNAELEELSAILSVFNIFRVLKIEKTEIRHSNVLAWLLDPQENHGLGDVFLRRFLSTMLMEVSDIVTDPTPADIELMPLADIEVLREWKNIDLLAHSKKNRWVLLIENKIKSGVDKKKLLKYKETVKSDPDIGKFKIIPVLFTLTDEEDQDIAVNTGFICWSHERWCNVIEDIFEQRRNQMPQGAITFLNDYLVTLRRLTMQEKKLIDLCKSIYKKHKAAVDLIMEYGGASQFENAAEAFTEKHKNEVTHLCLRPSSLWFLPKKWEKLMPPCSSEWKHLSKPYPIACWFNYWQGGPKVGLIIEIGAMENYKKRKMLIEKFQDSGFKFSKKTFLEGSRYSRAYSRYSKIEDEQDQEKMEEILNDLWEKTGAEIEKVGKIIKSFKW